MMVMAGSEPLIDIVIPNWNGRQFLGDCLLSLRRQSYDNFRVIVVDNGSRDGSCEFLRTNFPDVKLVSLPENTGFSYAVNTGITASQAPLILLLNNDMEVAEDCVERLAAALERYPEFDAFALKMINFHQRHLLDGAGDAVLRAGVGYRLGTMEEDGPLYQMDRQVFGACAGAALYRRDFFTTVGLFDPDFFAYLEDVDINLRARRLGKGFMYLSSAKVYHLGSATSGSKFNPLTIRLSTRNNILVLAKNYPLSIFIRFLPAIMVYQVAWMLFCCKKGLVVPYLQGIFQGLVSWPRFRSKGGVFFHREKLLSLDTFAALLKEAENEVIHSIMARRKAVGKSNILLLLYRKLFLS